MCDSFRSVIVPSCNMLRGLREADIALTEIANGKLTFESTLGQNGTEPVPHVVQFPEVIVAKKAVAKKKAA